MPADLLWGRESPIWTRYFGMPPGEELGKDAEKELQQVGPGSVGPWRPSRPACVWGPGGADGRAGTGMEAGFEGGSGAWADVAPGRSVAADEPNRGAS